MGILPTLAYPAKIKKGQSAKATENCLLYLSYANLTVLFHESFNWHKINWKVFFSSQSSCSFYCSTELIF